MRPGVRAVSAREVRSLFAVPSTSPPEPAPDLREAVREALGGMAWLTPADAGMRALALRIAEEIETARVRAEEYERLMASDLVRDDATYKRLKALESMCSATKVVGWLGPQLQGVLRDLYGAPQSRKGQRKEGEKVGGRLAQLQDAARQHNA